MKMKIDAHQHFWIYSQQEYAWIDDHMEILKKNYLPQNLLPLLQQNKVAGTIAVQARQSLAETRWLLSLAQTNTFIKAVVGWVDLCAKDLEEQLHEFSQHPKFTGVRHVVQDEPDDHFLMKKKFLRGVEKLERYHLTYDVLIFPRHLPVAIDFVSHFPEQRFVLDHIAKPPIKDRILQPWKNDIRRLASCANVYCKVSGMVTEANWQRWHNEDFYPYLDVVFEAFGPKRIMYGSDWPVCTLAGTYHDVFNLFIEYVSRHYSSDDIMAALFGGNAQWFYRISLT